MGWYMGWGESSVVRKWVRGMGMPCVADLHIDANTFLCIGPLFAHVSGVVHAPHGVGNHDAPLSE